MIIVGAGLSGLIAGTMLGDQVSCIAEAEKDVPNKHKALLRFRSSVVGDAVNVPFKKVKILKTSHPWINPVADAISYSIKTSGKAELRSIVSANNDIVERYIAPDNLVETLSIRLKEKFIFAYSMADVLANRVKNYPIISTIPMGALMQCLGYQDIIEFRLMAGTVLTYDLPDNYDIYCTVYIPSPDMIPYRVSITGNKLIIEVSGIIKKSEDIYNTINSAINVLGLSIPIQEIFANAKVSVMKYAKISPINEDVRKHFIMWASREHNIYSLGRYACWRPGLLLDDLVNDVRVIQRLLSGDKTHTYNQMKGR
jgi:hypothetical protein